PRYAPARGDGALARLALFVAAGYLLPDGLVRPDRFAALIHVADFHRVAELQRAGVRLLLPRDHAEQRRLAGAVGADDADDPALRQREIQVLDQDVVAVALPQLPRFDDDVAETRARRDVDLGGLDLLRRVLAQQVLVRVDAGLPFRLPRPRRHVNPFELAFERLLPARLRLLLLRQPRLLLLQPRRV